jgi:carotenoid cleavage oxygenase
MSTAVENRYLVGNLAPVKNELTVPDLPVEGALPKELSGRLLRNGPNPIAPDPATYHWFMGDGMLHGIELRDGKAASYRNRWIRTDQAISLLGEDPIPGQPDDVFPVGSSVANTHVVAHAGKIFALVEVCLPTQVRPDLSTVGRYDFGGKLRSAMTAHPKVDPVTGEMLFFGYDPFGPPWLRYHVANAAGELVRSEDIDIRGPSMVHDFAITERNVVFLDLPVVYDFDLVGKRPFPAEWKPDYGARVGVMPRGGGNTDVRWFDVELCYVFHPLNAYDDNDSVVIDVSRHPKMFATDLYGPAEQPPTLDRWTIDLDGGKVIEERLDDRAQEFPRVDDRVVGHRHRCGYTTTVGINDEWVRFGQLLKHDLQAGTTEAHDFGRGMHASEGVFVHASDDAGEDEGWVLSVVYDESRDGSDLVVLDATDFSGPPVATVRLPQRVPFGFHGSWVPEGAA